MSRSGRGVGDDIEIRVPPAGRVSPSAEPPRVGWADAAKKFVPGGLIDFPTDTRFDVAEWRW